MTPTTLYIALAVWSLLGYVVWSYYVSSRCTSYLGLKTETLLLIIVGPLIWIRTLYIVCRIMAEQRRYDKEAVKNLTNQDKEYL